jgi:two-component system sensor kinase FixL
METLIRDRRGRPEFIVAFLFDITARKEAEAALHESEERLRQLQSEFAYLTRASDLGEMAAGIAHEINQPLAAIVNFLSIGLLVAEQGYSEEGFAEAEEMMYLASAQALRAGETVRRIREFIGDGNGTRTIERVDGLVDAAMALALIDARSTGIEVRRIDGAGDAEVRVDAVQIQQILVNLLRNAMDELEDLPPGSERWLELSTQTHVGGVVEIEITDSGGGVPADIKEHIFDPFVTSKTGRMGMGLPICRRLAETHGVKIETESAPGRGATFKLVLPRFRPAAG